MSPQPSRAASIRMLLQLVRLVALDRYLGSSLGLAWSILQPLVTLLLFTFIFGFVFKAKVPGAETTFAYAIWMICGFGPWLSFTDSVSSATNVVVGNSALVKNMPIRSEFLVQAGGELAQVQSNIINFRDRFVKAGHAGGLAINFVASKENIHEVESFVSFWEGEGFVVQISTEYDIFDKNKPYFNLDEWGPERRMPCWSLWQGLYLTELGRLVSCGAMALRMGVRESIFSMTGPELWRCEAMQKLRDQQLTGVKPGYCKEFTCWTGQIRTWVRESDELRQYTAGSYSFMPVAKPAEKSGIKGALHSAFSSLKARTRNLGVRSN